MMGQMIRIRQQSGSLQAYVSIPLKRPHFNGAVIVAHEIWGLTDQVQRVADRLAEEGFYAIAPDLFSTDDADRRPSQELQREIFSPSAHVRYEAMPKLRALIAPTQTPHFTLLALSRLSACFEYVYNQPLVHQRVTMVGFGLGGDYTFGLAIREPRLLGAVPFYGHAPRTAAELRHIQCPILAIYGGKEQSLVRSLSPLSVRMRQAGVDFKAVVFDDAGHAFFNDSNVFAYNQSAADDAWRRTLSFLRKQSGVAF